LAVLRAGEAGQHPLNLADRHRLARGSVERNFGGLKQIFGMKASGQTLQPHRCNMPITIAAGTLQQIKLARGAFKKRAAQFAQQRRIVAGRRGKGRIKSTIIKRHKFRNTPD